MVITTPLSDQTREELDTALNDLAQMAQHQIPGCVAASVTVLHDGQASTMAATHERARSVDESQYRLGDGPCLAAMREREAVTVKDYRAEPRWPDVAAESLEIGLRSSLSLPLQAQGEVLGGLNLYGDALDAFGRAAAQLAVGFARQAAMTLGYLSQLQAQRAASAREHEVAEALQRSLLPTLPQIAGITAAARYLVSGEAGQLGGDWYDLFPLPDGAIGIAIGDVMGHDVTAAAAMGQLRSVLRSYAYEGSSPSTVLDRMDRLVQGFEMAEVATAIYGRLILDRGTGLFLFCSAGHLPPVVRDPDGTVRRLDRGSHPLIGALAPGEDRRGEAAVSLSPGSLILLYTDGLVETRTRHFDDGIDDVCSALAELDPSATPDQVCDALIEKMLTADPEDDVAVLALRIDL
jgi:serine phosphatase RsbU (regulator of sigma subunit)